MIHFAQTTMGMFEIGIDPVSRQLTRITLAKDTPSNMKQSTQMCTEGEKIFHIVKSQLQEYSNGMRKDFNLYSSLNWLQNDSNPNKNDQKGTPFQKKVWRALLTIPYGSTISYLEVAEKIKHPHAVRAVANAIGANPILILIPCHRVIRKNGALGGFSAGPSLKRKLLQLEQSVIASSNEKFD